MSGIRWALTIQLIGFFLASVSIAALRIEYVKKWADNLKSKIKEKNQQYQNLFIANNQVTLGPIALDNVIKSILSGILFEPFRMLVRLPIDGILFIRLTTRMRKYKKMINNLQNMNSNSEDTIKLEKRLRTNLDNAKDLQQKVTFYFKCRCKMMQAAWDMFIALIVQSCAILFDKFIQLIAAKLSGREIITNICIVIGTLVLIVGFILEIIVTP
jgi:hypothetical protein